MASLVILSRYLAAGWKPIEKPKSLSALEGRWIMKKNQVRLTCSSCFLNSWSCCCKQRERKKMLKLWRGKFLTVDTILCDWFEMVGVFFPSPWANRKKKQMTTPCLTCDVEAISFFLSAAARLFPQQQKTHRSVQSAAACGVCLTHKKTSLSIHATRFLKKRNTPSLEFKKKWVRARGFLEKPHYLNPRPRFCFFQ